MTAYLSDYLVAFVLLCHLWLPFSSCGPSKKLVHSLLGVKPIVYFEKHCATFLPHPCWAFRVQFAVSFDPMFQITSHIFIVPCLPLKRSQCSCIVPATLQSHLCVPTKNSATQHISMTQIQRSSDACTA